MRPKANALRISALKKLRHAHMSFGRSEVVRPGRQTLTGFGPRRNCEDGIQIARVPHNDYAQGSTGSSTKVWIRTLIRNR